MKKSSLVLLSILLLSSCQGNDTISSQPTQPPVVESSPNPNIRPEPKIEIASSAEYEQVIQNTINMVGDQNAIDIANRYGLNILNLTWEDTGRFQNSSVGPNISDMTIQVQHRDPANGNLKLSLMPVIRYPNFSDKSSDVKLDRFFLLVGNETGKDLKKITLREFLSDIRQYLNKPDSWKGNQRSLLADRDSHVLVSAQAAFLPIPKKGIAQFNPVLFNYQSVAGDPAVLTILATREGTSVTVIDNQRDGLEAGRNWGQRLFYNKNGDRASFTGKRLSDFRSEGGNNPNPNQQVQAASEQGLNMVLLIQVPLKQKNPRKFEQSVNESAPMPMVAAPTMKTLDRSDVENAVIGHGQIEGPFTEIDNLEIERDPQFPIRVTIQFYKGTSNGVVSDTDLEEINNQIQRVYKDADYVGSLVVDTDQKRPTQHNVQKK